MIAISHNDLVLKGAKWLNQKAPNIFYKCQYVCTELSCSGTHEIPDILGLRPHGNILIEVKVSISDFKRDFKKKSRTDQSTQIGHRRLFLIPKEMISVEDIPPSWGLLEWNGKEIELTKHSEKFEENKSAINFIYYSLLRRTNRPQVFGQ